MNEQPTSRPGAPPAKEYFPPRVQRLGTLPSITRGGSGNDGDGVANPAAMTMVSNALLKYDVEELD